MNRSANPEWWPDGSLYFGFQPAAGWRISTAGKKDESQTTLSDGSGIRPTTMGFQRFFYGFAAAERWICTYAPKRPRARPSPA